MDNPLIVQLVGPILLGIISFFLGRGKQDAEINRLFADATKVLLEPLTEEVRVLREQAKADRARIVELEKLDGEKEDTIKKLNKKLNAITRKYTTIIKVLMEQIERAGLIPEATLPAEEEDDGS